MAATKAAPRGGRNFATTDLAICPSIPPFYLFIAALRLFDCSKRTELRRARSPNDKLHTKAIRPETDKEFTQALCRQRRARVCHASPFRWGSVCRRSPAPPAPSPQRVILL